MSLISDLIAAGEELGKDAVSAIQADLGRESLAQHVADIVNGVIAATKRVEAIESGLGLKAEAVAESIEPTPAPVVPVAPVAQVTPAPAAESPSVG